MKTRLFQLYLASAAVTGALLSGVYAVAATAATSLAASIDTQETARHTRSVEFSTRAIQGAPGYPMQAHQRKPTTTRQEKP